MRCRWRPAPAPSSRARRPPATCWAARSATTRSRAPKARRPPDTIFTGGGADLITLAAAASGRSRVELFAANALFSSATLTPGEAVTAIEGSIVNAQDIPQLGWWGQATGQLGGPVSDAQTNAGLGTGTSQDMSTVLNFSTGSAEQPARHDRHLARRLQRPAARRRRQRRRWRVPRYSATWSVSAARSPWPTPTCCSSPATSASPTPPTSPPSCWPTPSPSPARRPRSSTTTSSPTRTSTATCASPT